MEIIHIWEVSATLISTRTDVQYSIEEKVVTKEKSFMEAEMSGLDIINHIVEAQYSHCKFDGLDDITYVGTGGTRLLNN